MMIAEAGLTVTVATGTGMTVTSGVVVLTDSVVAVIVAVPGAIAVMVTAAPSAPLTELAALTVNTAVLLDDQVTIRPLSVAPFSSCGVALISWPSPVTIGVIGVQRSSVATGARVTVIEAVPVFVSLVAVTVVLPGATAVTKPFASTVATASSLELHATMRPVRSLPSVSLVTAVSCCVGVIPSTRVAEVGVTDTAATGVGVTVIKRVGLEFTNSLIAVIVAVPTPTAVTVVVPLLLLDGFTVSTAVLLETQLTVRPVKIAPAASVVVAVSD